MSPKTEEKIRDILRRYGNFMDGYDADGDVLDINEAFEAIKKALEAEEQLVFLCKGRQE